MKKRLTFSRLLHSNKLMMVVSLVIAVAIWVGVLIGPANIDERSVSVTVSVDLTNTYYDGQGLRVIGENEFQVRVNVSGAWSVIARLDEEDFLVRPNLDSIKGPGNVELPLMVESTGAFSNYDILSVTPSTVSVMCDYWQSGTTFVVETDENSVSSLSVSDPATMQLGRPVLDTRMFPSGSVTLEGPKTTIAQINRVVARVETVETLSQTKVYDLPLKALDANGNEVDLTYCTFKELPGGTVSMTVPIWEAKARHILLGYTVANVPEGVDETEYLSIEPAAIDVLGTTAELDALEEQFGNLGTVNFASLNTTDNTVTFPLTIPDSVDVINAPENAVVKLKTENLAQKTLTLQASEDTVTFTGDAGGLKAEIASESVTVTLVGDRASVNAITAAALMLEVDIGNDAVAGTKQYSATLKINGYDDVWLWQDPDPTKQLSVHVTLK